MTRCATVHAQTHSQQWHPNPIQSVFSMSHSSPGHYRWQSTGAPVLAGAFYSSLQPLSALQIQILAQR